MISCCAPAKRCCRSARRTMWHSCSTIGPIWPRRRAPMVCIWGRGTAASPKRARLLGRDAQIGRTCHDSRHLAMEAGEQGADYVAFGAFYDTTTKPSHYRPATVDPGLVDGDQPASLCRHWRDFPGQCCAAGSGGGGLHCRSARRMGPSGWPRRRGGGLRAGADWRLTPWRTSSHSVLLMQYTEVKSMKQSSRGGDGAGVFGAGGSRGQAR